MSSIGGYLKRLGAAPFPVNVPSEEAAPDFTVGIIPKEAIRIADIRIPEITTPEVNFRFFIDGVQRTVPVCHLHGIPIFVAHLAAGAMERVDGRLNPFLKREAIVLYIPLEGLKNVCQVLSIPSKISEPPLTKFDYKGEIYELIRKTQQPNRINFWTDISIPLTQEEYILGAVELSAVGAVRRAARDRSKILLRIMELGVVWEVISQCIRKEDEFAIIDGPVFLPFIYAGLASRELVRISDPSTRQIGDRKQAYTLLRNVIGAVKRVEIIPAEGLFTALSTEPYFMIPVYRFSDVIEKEDFVSRHTLSCFIWLRRELDREIPTIWSPTTGLARVDIPFPAIVDPEVAWDSDNFYPDLSEGSKSRGKLEAILKTFITERYPVPDVPPSRILTELYAIAEVERWLKGCLLPEQELRKLAGV